MSAYKISEYITQISMKFIPVSLHYKMFVTLNPVDISAANFRIAQTERYRFHEKKNVCKILVIKDNIGNLKYNSEFISDFFQ